MWFRWSEVLKKICRVLGFRVLGFQSSTLLFDGAGFRVLVFGASLYRHRAHSDYKQYTTKERKTLLQLLGTCIRSTRAFGSRWLGFQMRGFGVYGFGVTGFRVQG